MKKLLLLLVASLTLSSAQCQLTSPDKVGESIFELLQDFGPDKLEAFTAWHTPLETFHKMGNDTTIEMRIRNSLGAITEDQYATQYHRIFDKLVLQTEQYGIEWNKIEMVEYTYEIKEEDNGMNGLEGTLKFSIKDVQYTIETAMLLYDGEYTLMFVNKLSPLEEEVQK
jgi:hypothetical protein